MDIYAKVILVMAVFNALIVAAWMIYLSKDDKEKLSEIVAKNESAAPLNAINYDDWLAKRIAANQRKQRVIAEFQALSELNNDFNAVIEGE